MTSAPSLPEGLPPRRRFRILSFDGGPSGPTYLRQLQRLVDSHPETLARADVFAGTSFGSFAALWLASRTEEELRQGRRTMAKLLELSNELYAAYGLPPCLIPKARAVVRAAIGWGPLVDLNRVVEFLQRPEVFGDRRLRDLNRKVCIVAFNLRSGRWGEGDPILRGWGARVFQNLRPDSKDPDCYPDYLRAEFDRLYYGTWPTDLDLPLTEAMLRSGAAPILIPIRAAHVDGAVFANNPSMAAVAEVMGSRNWINELYNRDNEGTAVPRGWLRGVEDVVVFSLGGDDFRFADERTQEMLDRSADPTTPQPERSMRWGWLPWALKWREPLLALKLLINGDGRGIAYQTQNVCSPGAFLRVGASVNGGIVRSFIGTMLGNPRIIEAAEKTAERWTVDADEIDELLDGLLPLPQAPPARIERPGTENQQTLAFPDEVSEVLAFADLLSVVDGVLTEVVDHRGEETGFVSDRMKAAVPKLLVEHRRWSKRHPEYAEVFEERLKTFWQRLLPELRRALGGEVSGPEDAFPVSYLLAALWLRISWLTPDDDELPPGVNERFQVTGSVWRVLLDPFYQLHWLQLLIDSGQLDPPKPLNR